MANDAAELLLRAGQEAGHVFEGDERDVEAVAEAHEARALVGRIDVEHASEHAGLVGDDADRLAGEPCEADHQVAGVVLLHLEEVGVVHHQPKQLPHVVGLHGVGGDHAVQALLGAVGGVGGRAAGRVVHVVSRQEAEQLANHG